MAASEGVVIGIETQLDAKGDVKLLKEINSPGIKIYFKFQNALENGRDLCKELKILGKKRICQIHCTDTDGVTLPYNERLDMNKVKKTLDKMGWIGWLVVERSRDKDDVRNVKKNYSTNIKYLKEVFQQRQEDIMIQLILQRERKNAKSIFFILLSDYIFFDCTSFLKRTFRF